MPATKKQVAGYIQEQHGLSQRRTASLVQCAPKTLRTKSKRPEDLPIRKRLRELAQDRPRFGYRRLHVLLRREGVQINHKKTHRLYTEEKLHLRFKKRRRRSLGERVLLERTAAPNQM